MAGLVSYFGETSPKPDAYRSQSPQPAKTFTKLSPESNQTPKPQTEKEKKIEPRRVTRHAELLEHFLGALPRGHRCC